MVDAAFFLDNTRADSARLAEVAARDQAAPVPSCPGWTVDDLLLSGSGRMAHETVVHRVDAELAAGEVTPVDPELAADGVDEVLRVMLCGPWWADGDTAEPVDAAVRLSTGDRSWTVWLDARQAALVEDGDAAAEIAGEPEDLLLWLWGRRDDSAVRFTGDPDVVRRFRRRLAEGLT